MTPREPSDEAVAKWTSIIESPIIELLAIKLYEHDFREWPVKHGPPSWMRLPEDDREVYRKIARGEEPVGHIPIDA